MKKTLLFPLFLFTSLLNSAVAPAQTTFTGNSAYVTINDITLAAESILLVDSAGAGGQKIHAASFTIKLNTSVNVKKVLTTLQTALERGEAISAVFSNTNFNNEVLEERKLINARVKQLILSDLAATTKESASLFISLSAEDVVIVFQKGGKLNFDNAKTSAVSGSNFRLELNGQVIPKVGQISRLHMGTNPPGPHYFSIEIPSSDAKSWYDWFNTTKPAERKKTVRIILLSADLKTDLISFELPETEIVSLSVKGGGENISRTKIGLRSNKALLK